MRNRANAALARKNGFPGCADIVPQRCHESETGDDYPAIGHAEYTSGIG